MRVLTVVGARPQFIKAAVVSRAFAVAGIDETVVHTGQHYDEAMSGRFLRQLGIEVSVSLDVGSAGHAHQTARIMMSLQDVIDTHPSPIDGILVYGDTNSTIAAGLVASKIDIPLIHVEAGLRSYNRAMPEEVNRVVVDHLSEILFCSSAEGVANLAREGVERNVHNVGDVMLDAFQVFSAEAEHHVRLDDVTQGVQPGFVLATIHRPSNTDHQGRLSQIVDEFAAIKGDVVWPVHPRNRARLATLRLPDNLHCIEPVGYFEMLTLLKACAAVVTDSGGLQKEAHWAQRRCVTLRDETEWVETLEGGWNVLAAPGAGAVASLVKEDPSQHWHLLYGDGGAAARIADICLQHLGRNACAASS